MGIKKLRRIQVGPEATAGTAVAATERLFGPGASVQALDNVMFVEHDDGDIVGRDETVKTRQFAQVAVPERAFSFEQFVWLLQCGVAAQQTGVDDAAGTGKIYTHVFPRTAAATIKTLTVEAGDNVQAHEMEYGFCRDFTVSGETTEEGQVVQMGATLQGRQRAQATFTALDPASVTFAPANLGSLYIDDADGTVGTSQVEATLVGWSLRVTTGLVPVFSADGELYFTTLQQTGPEIVLDMTLRYLAGAEAEAENWLGEVARQVELKLEGAALTTSGAYAKHTARFQLPGKWEEFTILEDRNGDDIVRATFRSRYNHANTNAPQIIVVNERASYWS